MHGHRPHPSARAHAFGFGSTGLCCCCGGPMLRQTATCFDPPFAGHHNVHGKCECHEDSPGTGFHRRFVSRGEKIAKLEIYLADLQAEAKAVQEKIAQLRASS